MSTSLRQGFGRQAGTIASSTLWQFASQAVMAVLSIATTKFVAIGLSKELAGTYNSAYGYLQLFGILADFGLYAVAVREVSRAQQRERVLGALIVLRLIILCLSLGSALLIAWLMPMWRGTPLPLSVTIAALVPFFTLLAGMLRTVFQVHFRMHYVFIAEVSQRVVTVLLISLFIAAGVRASTDLQILHLFLFVGGIGAFILFLLSFLYGKRMLKITPSWDPALLKSLFFQAAPFGLAFVCTAIYRQFDISMIALLRDDFQLQNASYGFAQRTADMAYLIPTFLLNSVLPILAERHDRNRETRDLLGRTLLAILMISAVSALFAGIVSRPLMQLLTTDAYLSTALRPGADTALQILALPMFFNGIIVYAFYILLTRHLWQKLISVLLLGAALSVVLNALLIPQFGFIGAGITSIVVHALLVVLLLPLSLRAMPARIGLGQLGRLTLFILGIAAALFAIEPFMTSSLSTLAALAAAVAGVAGLAFLTGLHRIVRAPLGVP